MKIYRVETQQAYDELMIELEEKGCKWRSGHEPTTFNYWEQNKEDSCIQILAKYITFMNIEQSKKQHPNIPIIEYKAKGENMPQEEMKRYFLNESRDISIAIENFVVDDSTTENPLSKAKSSAKKLIEKIDEYLESQKPKFKVGDYAVELGKYITKIEKIDDGMPKGCFYMPGNNHFSPIKDSVSSYIARYATPSEIAEYEAALTFHKHGRKPFEVKDGDLLENKFGRYIANGYSFSKEDFMVGSNTLLKTAEEVNEWLCADDENRKMY